MQHITEVLEATVWLVNLLKSQVLERGPSTVVEKSSRCRMLSKERTPRFNGREELKHKEENYFS